MFPIIALGAALFSGIAIAASSSSSAPSAPDSGANTSSTRAAAPPPGGPSYLVTPLTAGSPSAQSAVDAVRRFTV